MVICRRSSSTAEDNVSQDPFNEEMEFTSFFDGFSPLHHMGMLVEEIMKLTPTDQKKRALATLPTILRKLATMEVVSDILINLAVTPNEEFPSCLSTDGFQRCLVSKGDTAPQDKILYRSSIRLRQQDQSKHNGRSMTTIAHDWLHIQRRPWPKPTICLSQS